jgi:hypothetical protein
MSSQAESRTVYAAGLVQGGLAERFGAKRVYLTGLSANLAAMLLLIVSRFMQADQDLVSAFSSALALSSSRR